MIRQMRSSEFKRDFLLLPVICFVFLLIVLTSPVLPQDETVGGDDEQETGQTALKERIQTEIDSESQSNLQVNEQSEEQEAEEEETKSAVPLKLLLSLDVEIDSQNENLEKQLQYFTEIVKVVQQKRRDGFFDPFNHESLRQISGFLKEAAELEADPCYKNYLQTMSDNVLHRSVFFCSMPRWIDLEENLAEIIFVKNPRYGGQLTALNQLISFRPRGFNWKKDSIFDPVVYLNHPEETREFEVYNRAFAQMQDNIPIPLSLSTAYTPVPPSIKIVDYVPTVQPRTLDVLYPDISNIHPENDFGYDDRTGFKIVIFKNLAKSYYENVLFPIAANVMSETCLDDMSFEIYFSNLVMARIAHHLGPVFAVEAQNKEELEEEQTPGQSKDVKERKPKKRQKGKIKQILKTMPELLKDMFPVVESMKAQSLAVHNASVLMETGIISEYQEAAVYTNYLVTMLDRMRRVPTKGLSYMSPKKALALLMENGYDTYVADRAQLSYLLQHEAIALNINSGKLDLDPVKFKETIEKIASLALRFCKSDSYGAAKQYFANKLSANPQIEEIMKLMKDVPVKISYDIKQDISLPDSPQE